MNASKALVVEDDEHIAALVECILEQEGFAIRIARDGREAVAALEPNAPPAFVILDVMLPYLNGYELIERIRATPGWNGVPVLMLSAKGADKDIVRALDAGADDYIVKPFSPEELAARVRRVLKKT